jgi:hypothetical protein
MSVFSKLFAPSKRHETIVEDRLAAKSGNIATRQDAETDRTSITGELPGQQWADTATSLGADAASALSSIYGKGMPGAPIAPPPGDTSLTVATSTTGLPSWAPWAGAAVVGGGVLYLALGKK